MSIFSGQDTEKTAGMGSFVALSQKKDEPVVETAPPPQEEMPTETHGAFGAPTKMPTVPETPPAPAPAVEVKPETPKLFGQGVIKEESVAPAPQQPPLASPSPEKFVDLTLTKPLEKSFSEMSEEEKMNNITERADKLRAMLANATKERTEKGLPNSFMFGVISSAKASFDTLKNDVEKMGRGTSPQFAVRLNNILSGLPADIARAEEEFKKTASEITEKNKTPDGTPPLPAISKKVGEDIKPKMPMVQKKEEATQEQAPSAVVYGRPGTIAEEPQQKATPQTELPPQEMSTPETQAPQATQEVEPEAKPLTPTTKQEEVAPPILETGGDATPGVARLLATFKRNVEKAVDQSSPLAKGVAVAVLLSTSPAPEIGIPKPQTKQVASFATKESSQQTSQQTGLSPEERNLFSLLATKDIAATVSGFNLDDATYKAVCEKMQGTGITPYKMLHDGSFTTFEIATSNGNRDVRKEISDLIASAGALATKLGIENPVVTEYSNESLEQYLARLQDVVKKSVARTS